jgi:hypothetical protein
MQVNTLALLLKQALCAIIIRTLLDDDCGVIVAVSVVSAKVADDVEVEVVVVPETTCKIRKAPLRSFC